MKQQAFMVLARLDWWLVLTIASLSLLGLVFVHSATHMDERFAGQHLRQTLFLATSAGLGLLLVLIHYGRVMRSAWVIYGLAVLALALLPVFGTTLNGARRWYSLPGFSIQPAEFAKLALIIALAAYLRFKPQSSVWKGLCVPVLITAVPAMLVMRQPDLGSSLVFWPILLAVSYAAGASGRSLIWFGVLSLLVILMAYFFLHDYQRLRVDVWAQHFSWASGGDAGSNTAEVRQLLRGPAYQPWQSLIAIGSGGFVGAGLNMGPQNRFDFLPYRNADYIFSVVAEETGFLGAVGLLLLQAMLVFLLLRIAQQTRERFGRLVVVGVAAYLGAQSLMHVAVCTWLVPATGLPLPLLSYGGSSTMVAVLALALALNVGARREPVMASDGFS